MTHSEMADAFSPPVAFVHATKLTFLARARLERLLRDPLLPWELDRPIAATLDVAAGAAIIWQ